MIEIERLMVENSELKERVAELETEVRDYTRAAEMLATDFCGLMNAPTFAAFRMLIGMGPHDVTFPAKTLEEYRVRAIRERKERDGTRT